MIILSMLNFGHISTRKNESNAIFQIPVTSPISFQDFKIHLMVSTLWFNVFKTLQDLGGYKDLVVVLLSHLQEELMNFAEAE